MEKEKENETWEGDKEKREEREERGESRRGGLSAASGHAPDLFIPRRPIVRYCSPAIVVLLCHILSTPIVNSRL
jgi:hypothetical protein